MAGEGSKDVLSRTSVDANRSEPRSRAVERDRFDPVTEAPFPRRMPIWEDVAAAGACLLGEDWRAIESHARTPDFSVDVEAEDQSLTPGPPANQYPDPGAECRQCDEPDRRNPGHEVV